MYVETVLTLIQLMAPITIVMAAFAWWFHAHDRSRDTRTPKPRLRLSLILASNATIVSVGSAYLAIATALFRSGHPLPADWAAVTLTVILALELPPLFSAGYLLYLRGKED